MEEVRRLDFQVIKEPIRKIANELENQLDKYDTANLDIWEINRLFFVKSGTLTGFETLKAIVRLITKNSEPKYHVQANMLSRTLIDCLFNLVAILGNDENIKAYVFSGLREELEKYDNMNRFNESEEMRAQISQLRNYLNLLAIGFFQLEENWADRVKNSKYWPIPSRMIANEIYLNGENRALLERVYYLDYKDFSKVSHQSWYGSISSYFNKKIEDKDKIQEFISNPVHKACLFLIMIFSEVVIYYGFNQKEEIRFLWKILTANFDDAKSYYELKYHQYF
jgi:hypothetical protein